MQASRAAVAALPPQVPSADGLRAPLQRRRGRPLRIEDEHQLFLVTSRTLDSVFWLHPLREEAGTEYVDTFARPGSGVPKTHSNRAPAPAPDVSDETLLRRGTKTVPFASAASGLELARGHAGSWPHWMRWSVQAQHEINLRGLPREQLGVRAYPKAERPCVGRRPS